MFALLNAYFSYDKDPVSAVRSLAQNRRFGVAFAGYAAAALCWVVFFFAGDGLSAWGLLWRFCFFWLLEATAGYLWSALSGLFLGFWPGKTAPASLFIVMGLSGFAQGLILCFALCAAAAPWLKPLGALALIVTLLLRFVFVLLNASRAAQTGWGRMLGALLFAFVPVAAAALLGLAGFVWLAASVL